MVVAVFFLILIWRSEKLAVLCSRLSCIVPSNLECLVKCNIWSKVNQCFWWPRIREEVMAHVVPGLLQAHSDLLQKEEKNLLLEEDHHPAAGERGTSA